MTCGGGVFLLLKRRKTIGALLIVYVQLTTSRIIDNLNRLIRTLL